MHKYWVNKHLLTRLALGCVIGLAVLSLTGCFLQLLFVTIGQRDTDFGSVFIATIGGTFGPLAVCDLDHRNDGTLEQRGDSRGYPHHGHF